MLKTTNYNLVKIELADSPPDITVLNPNFDTIDAELANRVLKESGKGLSTNDFTTVLLNKLNGIAANANNYTHPSSHPPSIIAQDVNNRFVTDTEKSTWNAKASTAVATTLANGLMSKEDKAKLDGIEAGANAYVHPSSHPASMISQTASYRFVTDTEKSTWNGKANTTVATTSANGLMSSTDKSKLDGIATNANNYTHPSTHPPSIIAQDSSNRFVTDTEKSTWNAKASTAIVTTSVNGLMSAADKVKLNGIAAGANNYTHPSTHPASMIVEETNKKFITQAQIAAIDSWTSLKNSGGTVSGDIDLVRSGITTHLGYSSLTPVASSWSVKGGIITTPVGLNLAVQPGQWSALLPFKDSDLSIGRKDYKFLDQYLSGDSFASRHVGGNPGQDKRYRLAVDNGGNFTIQKITESGDWLFNIMQDANNSSGNGDMALGCADLYFGSYTKDGFGYSKIGNGFIIQWGSFAAAFSSGITDKPIGFPIAFPNRCTSIVSNMLFIGGGDVSLVTGNSVNSVTQTGFRHSARYSPGGNYAFQMCWIAIGY